jgi:hypothetical protein
MGTESHICREPRPARGRGKSISGQRSKRVHFWDQRSRSQNRSLVRGRGKECQGLKTVKALAQEPKKSLKAARPTLFRCGERTRKIAPKVFSAAKSINLAFGDLQKEGSASQQLHAWTAPCSSSIAMIFLWPELDAACSALPHCSLPCALTSAPLLSSNSTTSR